MVFNLGDRGRSVTQKGCIIREIQREKCHTKGCIIRETQWEECHTKGVYNQGDTEGGVSHKRSV